MRVLYLALSSITLAHYSHAQCNLDGITVTGCSFDSVSIASQCSDSELSILLGTEYKQKIEMACSNARTNADKEMLPWDAVTKRGYQFDKEFFNGGTIFNTEVDSTDFINDTRRLAQIRDELLPKHGIAWPSKIDNFKNCAAQSAMCCWVSSRDPQMQGSPVDNTDVCSHDMGNSPRSAHVEGGETVFQGDEGAVNCHGFYWDQGERYRGNLLFHVAMSHGLLQNKYVRNIPGAPMCGCVEQMPVVTHSDCTAMQVSESFLVSLPSNDADDFSIKMVGDPAIQFTTCSGDGSLTDGHSVEGHPGDLDKYVTGKATCEDEEYDALDAMGYKKRADDDQWIPVAGKGYLYNPSLSKEDFNALFAKSPNQIVRRRCFECNHTHKDIYYRRYDTNGLPAALDLLHIFKNYWYDVDGNKFHADFELYSTYDDALNNRNAWMFCNFNDKNVGFPRDCGPVTFVPWQWNAFQPVNGHLHGRYHVGFYVESENNKVGLSRTSST